MSNKITLFQNERNWATIREQVLDMVDREHGTGMAQNGPLIQLLEDRLSKYAKRKHCITVANCTDALVISLMALQLPLGSRVAVSNYTFTATAHAVARAGYTVVPVDIDADYCINPGLIKDVAAVVAVDLFGNISNWSALEQLGIPIINDSAQSFESHNGQKLSVEYGLASCVSFSPSKTISSWGSGGAILTDNDDLASCARHLRLHGKITNDSLATAPGLNSMLSSFEAACIWAGLDHSQAWQQRRDLIAKYLIKESSWATATQKLPQHTHHKLVFQSDIRDSIINQFKQAEIDCAIHYRRLINDELLYNVGQEFPISDRFKAISFTVPNQHTLTDLEVERIAKELQ